MARGIVVAVLIAGLGVAWAAQSTQPQQGVEARARAALQDDAELVARGEYITHHVAMCIQCHTPRNDAGELDRTRLFQGAAMPVRSPFPNQLWAFQTPHIAGLPGWTDDEGVKFLMSGKDLRGREPLGPMPPFRMNREDAMAVVAYLKSLK